MSKSEVGPTQKVLNVWAIILILWSFYRVTFRSDLPIWFDEFIAKPLVFLFPLFIFITKFEHKSFLNGIGFKSKNILKDVVFGVGMGSLFIGIAVFTRLLKGAPFLPFHITTVSAIWVISSIMAAALEQILSTGFIFKRLSEESKNIVKPLAISALLFFFLHVPVLFGADKISGYTLLQMIMMNTVLSLITSIVFLMRKNTVAPIIIHAFYLLSLPILL